MEAPLKKSILRLIGFSIYVLIGGAVLMQIEKGEDQSAVEQTLDDFLLKWMKTYNISRENVRNILRDFQSLKENGYKPSWSFITSVYFVLQLITTIGYGNITPATAGGQVFTIIYAFLGIPITLLALHAVGKVVNIELKKANRPLHRKRHGIACQETQCCFLEKANMCVNLCCFVLTWAIVTTVQACLEPEESLVFIVYSMFVTYSTVGFGDFIPFEKHKSIFIVFVLPGLSFLSGLIDSIVAYMEKSNVLERRCYKCVSCLGVKMKAKKARINSAKTVKAQDSQDTAETDINAEHVV